MSSDDFKRALREADSVGCYGLLPGYAKNKVTNRKHFAESATKSDGPFYCPLCYSDAIIRKCVDKIDHFAHTARLSPIIKATEGHLHKECKEEICSELSKMFPEGKWDVERVIPERHYQDLPKLVPDISGRINDQRLAIEIQASSLSIKKIIRRIEGYSKRNIPILWIVPLSEPLGNKTFRPRLFERYLHSIYFGRTYYWSPGQGTTLTPVHYSLASRYIDYSEWRDENGEFQEAGGYDKYYKIIKKPLYGQLIKIETDFRLNYRKRPFTPPNESKSIPPSLTWQDRLNIWWDQKNEDLFNEYWRKEIANFLETNPFRKEYRTPEVSPT
ncbi:MAG: hypothetical protein HF981_06935 [Desulfobacteraceae bacterium]|nr:hypothetical protein [Desulfobacteraceae bacterium]MBC2750104.1 hypothetical protein [Desulfobacteraceae bacterium]